MQGRCYVKTCSSDSLVLVEREKYNKGRFRPYCSPNPSCARKSQLRLARRSAIHDHVPVGRRSQRLPFRRDAIPVA